jgi:hypothetical protein
MTCVAIMALSCVTATWSHYRSTSRDFRMARTLSKVPAFPPAPAPAGVNSLAENGRPAMHLLPVLLSIEPAGTALESELEGPVVLPGYVLPDDNREEPAHGGS